jgi:hypothetical protein
MPVRIVLDHPRRYAFRRLWRRILMVIGAVLLVVGIAASIVAVPANVLAAAWFLDEDIDIEFEPGRTLSADQVLLGWAVSTPLAFFGVRRGLRLVRGRRSLVLFLRRFGYDDATSAVTFAVTRTIGNTWRLVTLDDAEIAALGVATSTRGIFRAIQLLSNAGRALVELLLRVFPTAQLGLWIIVGADLVRARIWEHAADQGVWMRVLNPYVDIVATTFDGRLPVDAIAFSLPGMFAILAVGLAGIVIALGAALTTAPLLWVVTAVFLFFASFPADTVREAEQLKTRDVQNPADIDSAAYVLAQWSRRVFGPRLVVLRVASNIWRQTVSRMVSVSSVALIDVSEPTENLIWEIEELTRRSQTKCVFICRHDRALQIAAAAASVSPSSFDDDMGRLLEMEEILAYTTDRSGIKRFARALRGTLLSRAA